MRATRYPSYFDFNVVRVEDDPAMSVEALIDFADEALAGLAHRRIDFDLVDAAEPLATGFETIGWKATQLVWMRHDEAAPPAAEELSVEEVPYDAVHDLRVAWHREDFPDQDPDAYLAQAREVARRRRAQVLTVREAGVPIGFAQLERDGSAAEITRLYVHPNYRGGGRGTALTRTAIETARSARDLWIVADDKGRAKELYARLGFRPAWTRLHFLRLT